MVDDAKAEQISARATPFARSQPLLEPVSRPADFLEMDPQRYEWLYEGAQLWPRQEELVAALQRDQAPIPAPQNREGYNRGHDYAYWISGYLTYLNVTALAAQHGVVGGRYFDFGGSTGRLFRHFAFQTEAFDVWSCDFNVSSTQWNLKHFPNSIKSFQNMYFPFLPLEDNYFDLITAMSVFTHIDEMETQWLLELRRVLKSGALALITIQDEHAWKAMHENVRHRFEESRPDLAGLEELPEGRHVATLRSGDAYSSLVAHSQGFIRQQWSRYYEVLDIIPGKFSFQAAVLLRKPL
jgi:ubiquinone/menaquinone biosynthesis C-methylase UbiE